MNNCNPWIFNDRSDDLWRFSITENGDFIYNVMYGDDKWTKEKKIDTEILEFAVNIDGKENIHIVYINKKRQLKYCVWENSQWLGKILYSFEDNNCNINELSLIIKEEDIHIFFILKKLNVKHKASLMHYLWHGEKYEVNTICNINLIDDLSAHYYVETESENKIYLLLISGAENGGTLRVCRYMNNSWSKIKNLYIIRGNKISFYSLIYKNKFHILNLSREHSIYSLEYVSVDFDGNMKSTKVNESLEEIINPTLFIRENTIFALWQRENNVLCSSFKDHWYIPIRLNSEDDDIILVYNYITSNINGISVKTKKVFGTDFPDIKLFSPRISLDSHNNKEIKESDIQTNGVKDVTIMQSLQKDIPKLKEINKNLYERIDEMKMQLQHKQKFINEIEENLRMVLEKNKKIEENCSFFAELQKSTQIELEKTKKQLENEENLIKELQYKVKDLDEKYKDQCQHLEGVNEEKQQMQKDIEKSNEEKQGMKKDIEKLNEEKQSLEKELEDEKNMPFMYRVLNKKK